MPYKVAQPFTNGTEEYRIGQVIGDEIEQCRNFTRLLGGASGTMRPFLVSLVGEADGCFIIRRRFTVAGKGLKPGDFVDTRGAPWRNETALLKLNWIRRATEAEVRLHTGDDGVDALIETPEVAGDGGPPRPQAAKPWEDQEWLTNEYTSKTIRDIAEEQGCSVTTIQRSLKKLGIETRPRGKQGKGDNGDN